MTTNLTRLENDIHAFQSIKPILLQRGWAVVNSLNLVEALKKGATFVDLVKMAKIKNINMFNCLLAFLVGEGILRFESGKYFFIEEPPFPSKEDFEFLYSNYYGSMQWLDKVSFLSYGVLVNNITISKLGFGEDADISLWEIIMSESPYSFRKIVLDKLLQDIHPHSSVLDFGCGGGIAIEQLLHSTPVPLNVMGIDQSSFYLTRAQNRVLKLKEKNKSATIINSKVLFKVFDFMHDPPLEEKFDRIFISLVLNHLSSKERSKLFVMFRGLLKKNGRLGIFQITNPSPHKRSSLCWVMHTVPTHKCYPQLDELRYDLSKNFDAIEESFGGSIFIATAK